LGPLNIKFEFEQERELFESETESAITWLLDVRDKKTHGWGWVENIPSNVQNTAEVVSALLENSNYLTDREYVELADAVQSWLIHPEQQCEISLDWVWVLLALQSVRDDDGIKTHLDTADIDNSIRQCIGWLVDNQNPDGGWADVEGGLSSTARTSLAVIALGRERPVDDGASSRLERSRFKRLKRAIERAIPEKPGIESSLRDGVKWLQATRNGDGGWGNIREKDLYRSSDHRAGLSSADLRYQCDSNVACTGYAVLALCEDSLDTHAGVISEAIKYIRDHQQEYGGWDVFSEVGRKGDTIYTFRHFSTTWALRALLRAGGADYTDECVIDGINYLAQLQDTHSGGWRSSVDADTYTWATCNVLETIRLIKSQLAAVKAQKFLQIVCEWWELRKRHGDYSLSVGNTIFAFNEATIVLFSIVSTVAVFCVTAALSVFLHTIFPEAASESAGPFRLVNGILIVLGAFIIGLPWVVYVKNVFKKDMSSWIESVGWVYGIITGFLLAYYQIAV